MEKKYEITEQQAQSIMSSLVNQPYKEVYQGVKMLQELKEIKEPELEVVED